MAAADFGFLKCRNFNSWSVQEGQKRHHAKRCGDRSNHCRDMAIFGFFNMAVAAIWDFLKF